MGLCVGLREGPRDMVAGFPRTGGPEPGGSSVLFMTGHFITWRPQEWVAKLGRPRRQGTGAPLVGRRSVG